MNVLVLNAGSSSLKFQIITTDLQRIADHSDLRLCRGAIQEIGGDAEIVLHVDGRAPRVEKAAIPDVHAALDYALRWITSENAQISGIRSITDIDCVGHRVVHGGEHFFESSIITDQVLQGIRDCIDLAPLHNPRNIEGIEAVRKVCGPKIPHVAVFDTAFHHTMPEHAYIYAVPYRLYETHRIRRYGFHGTSHRYVAHRYGLLNNLTRDQTNVISLHLGNGCSAAAIKAGFALDTSMGMTPLEGLVMGTRSGDIDPSLVGFIAEKDGLSVEQVETMLNTESGLLGISGMSSDMRELQRAWDAENDRLAALAIDVFCYRVRKYIGAFLAAMDGADAVLFTGGIGENAPVIRSKICQGLQWAGLTLEPFRNEKTIGVDEKISTETSALRAFCIPTDEELLIAHDTVRCILGEPHPF